MRDYPVTQPNLKNIPPPILLIYLKVVNIIDLLQNFRNHALRAFSLHALRRLLFGLAFCALSHFLCENACDVGIRSAIFATNDRPKDTEGENAGRSREADVRGATSRRDLLLRGG